MVGVQNQACGFSHLSRRSFTRTSINLRITNQGIGSESPAAQQFRPHTGVVEIIIPKGVCVRLHGSRMPATSLVRFEQVASMRRDLFSKVYAMSMNNLYRK
jgi:hypothetical protein